MAVPYGINAIYTTGENANKVQVYENESMGLGGGNSVYIK